MFIKELNLLGFRNYIQESIAFESAKTILIGKNAQGKSNLLEVIQVISQGKSKRASKDAELVNWELKDAVIHLKALKDKDELNISAQIRKSGRRTIKVNEIKTKPGDLPGLILSVSFMVDDLEIVYGSPATRRAWIDSFLVQLSKVYKSKLNDFEKALSQRNSFLKSLIEKDIFHPSMMNKIHKEQLKVWDELFMNTANDVIKERTELLGVMAPLASENYSNIASNNSSESESLDINYLGDEISEEDIEDSLSRDFARGFTNIGPHRQDIEFTLDDQDAGAYASQGQRRTIVLALKLSELELLKAEHSESPVLLLDDVLAELDEDRQDFLLDAVADDTQVIITTTHIGEHLEKWRDNAQILTIESGSVKREAYV